MFLDGGFQKLVPFQEPPIWILNNSSCVMWKRLVKIHSLASPKNRRLYCLETETHLIGDHFIISFKWMKTSQVELMKCRISGKQTTPFLFSHKEQWSANSPLHPPCLGKSPSWLTTVALSELQLSMLLLSHQHRIPQTGCFPLWYESSNLFPCHFFAFHLHHPPPSFLTHFHFFQLPLSLSNPSFSNLKGYFKRMLVHQMQLSEGSFGKNNNLFCPSSCQKIIVSHVFDSIDRNT